MSNTKRILSITVKRLDDPDPDTSYLGEYSNTCKSEFSIDRKHSLDCVSANLANEETVNKLERAITYIRDAWVRDIARGRTYPSGAEDDYEAIDILIKAQDLQKCDCDESGDMSRGEYRYFNPATTDPHESDEQNRKDALSAYERMERLQAGDWGYIGIRAEVEISINDTIQTLTSAGLWGIESDSDKSYLKEVADEELLQLRSTLYEMGFSKRAIATAVKKEQR